ncbi:rRNA methyltransferase [Corynebacterium sp. HMSC062E11]|nr:methyltransferase [Corynebacterium aurimucosum]OFK26913.1 rRNA methyltransferase [Corynebacterium sp. HMSC062E11]OFK61266.1 rRNA methyltransferase [Corynebacterium sp. HMSC078A10]OFM33624.1 rRNA methyltransferase [Corynebacterium sp. HMSC072A02]OFP68747.1 rRNA methyltransferase [Corynebacterium sp. HMSC078C09]
MSTQQHSPFGPAMNPDNPIADVAEELAHVFAEAGLSADGIAGHLGPEYTEALHRGEPAAVALGASGDSRLDHLIRIFLLHEHVPATLLSDVLGARLATRLLDCGAVLTDEHGTAYVAYDIRPHVIVGKNRIVFSDVDASLVDHVPGPEHVLGVGSASLSLLHSTPTTPVSSVLDLGTGSGVQILGQLESAERIVATDVHERALQLARATVAAAGAENRVELRQGSWFEPVRHESFDRIVANPPFVVGLPEVGHVYRDSGLNLDGASELVISQAVEHLNPGGTAHILAAWVHQGDKSWQQRVASWLPDTGVAAWIIQRDVADPALYVSTWLSDESVDVRSAEGQERSRRWLEHFCDHDVTGIGFGFVAIQRIADDEPSDVLAETMAQPVIDPLGPEVEEYFARIEWLRNLVPGELETKHVQLRPGVAREDVSLPDTELGMGFERAALRLSRTDGPRWQHDVDEHLAAIVAGLNPHGLSIGETIELYAAAQGFEESELVSAALPAIVDLIRHGLLIPTELLAFSNTE